MDNIIYNADPSYIPTLISIIGGALIGGIFTYIFSVKILKRQNFNQASAKFRSSFVETERAIDDRHNIKTTYVHGEFVYELVLPHIPAQEKAMVEFSHFLRAKDRLGFQKVWMKYAYPNWYDEVDDSQLDYKSVHVDKQADIRKLLRKRLDEVFKYAEYK